MAGRRDIEAGRAFVSLALNDSAFVKGLRKNGERLKTFGTTLAGIGAGITAAGAAIIAPLGAMVKGFLDAGDELDKMRQRTGISVEALSELGHAAGQSGTDLVTLETGIAKMQKQITLGGKAFEGLGLSVEALQAMSPEQQFETIATAIGKIEDPTERAGRAMEIFGRSGTQLLPMIEDLEALRQEARDLGFVMSGEAAAASVKLGDMLANLWKTVQFAGHAVAEALTPALMDMVAIVQRAGTGLLKWIPENKQLVVTIAAIGTALVVAGTAVTGFGLAVVVVGAAMTGLATAIGAIGTVLGVVTSPLGIVVGLLASGVYLWANFTESGRNAVDGMKAFLSDLMTTATMTFGGIYDAIAAGDLALAGQIAITGLKVAMLQGLDALANAVGGMIGDLIGTIGMDLLSGDLSGAWSTILSGMSSMLADFVNGAMNIWAKLKFGFLSMSVEMWAGTRKLFIEGAKVLVSTLTTLGTMYLKLQSLLGTDTSVAQFGLGMLGTGINSALDKQKTITDLAASGAQVGIGVAQASEIADNAAARDAKREEFRTRTRGGASGASAAAADAEAELEALRAQAAQARAEADKESQRRQQQAGSAEAEPGAVGKVFGTFSAAALQAAGQGQDPALSEQRKTNKKLDDANQTLKDTLEFIKATGAWT